MNSMNLKCSIPEATRNQAGFYDLNVFNWYLYTKHQSKDLKVIFKKPHFPLLITMTQNSVS